MKSKLFKDPIYGYIDIDVSILNDIIDSSCFQRLRNIRQTSYSPLYSASMHNRFIHSIGVYFLGVKAFSAFRDSVATKFGNIIDFEWMKLEKTFTLACLLHDVGHAPFSHSGENFFLNENGLNGPLIYEYLVSVVGAKEFEKDINNFYHIQKVAAPHEIMSVIVAINSFGTYLEDDKEFFARCITGYKYRTDLTFEKEVKNCLISLLNSSIIDVDKLDYIIRDAFMTGFQSVSIDFNRLLSSLTMVKENGKYLLAYNKGALSIIENVIYAHDSERKWIQNHPIVLYEHFLIQHSIKCVDKYYSMKNKKGKKNRLFSYNSISCDGSDFKEKGKISLLSDEDIIYNIKNVCGDEITNEYFTRNSRRHPVWKSEAEYRALIVGDLGGNKLDELEFSFKNIEKYLTQNCQKPIINNSLIEYCENELNELNLDKRLLAKDKEDKNTGLLDIIRWSKCLKDFASENDMPFDFVVISANNFKSGFMKEDIDNILIDFPNIDKPCYIKNILTVLNSIKSRESYFYLFYKRLDGKKIDSKSLAKHLIKELMK